jgi:hypothetical protein
MLRCDTRSRQSSTALLGLSRSLSTSRGREERPAAPPHLRMRLESLPEYLLAAIERDYRDESHGAAVCNGNLMFVRAGGTSARGGST